MGQGGSTEENTTKKKKTFICSIKDIPLFSFKYNIYNNKKG